MALYSIEDTTLVNIGNAIRNKTIGQEEPYYFSENEKSFSRYDTLYTYEFPQVEKLRIRVNISFSNTNNNIKGPGFYGYIPRKETYFSFFWDDEDFVSFADYGTYNAFNWGPFDYEGIVDSNIITIGQNKNDDDISCGTIDIEIWGLDANGNEYKYTPLEMADAINSILPGPPTEAFVITDDCNSLFKNGKWDWFIELYGNQIVTNSITDLGSMFNGSKVKSIPFDINITKSTSGLANVISNCSNLTTLPNIIGPERTSFPTGTYSNNINLMYAFSSNHRLREIPNDYFWKIVPNVEWWEARSRYDSITSNLFTGCYSLRELPDISMLGCGGNNPNYTIYSGGFNGCYVLNKIIDLPVGEGTYTSNKFSYTFSVNSRISDMIFVTDNGTPKTANWKSQTIDLSSYIGYARAAIDVLQYNSGITVDKQVKDLETYEALKNDPDWFTTDINYSRYNHDSAVRTINSLPDTSAYLATNGGTNTIKFQGASGALTDGGAINTLTSEEIAVATAKGWTVTLS